MSPDDGSRRSLVSVVAVVVVLNAAAWGLYAVASAGGAVAAGAGALAFVLGMRHAFDADHIAVIDDCSRLAASQGRRRPGLGLSFALGHSTVVLLLTVVVALAATSLAAADVERWQVVGGRVSTAFAAAFLLVVGLLNVRLLARLRRASPAEAADLGTAGGVFTRVLGIRAQGPSMSSWRLFPVGFLFGLGLETASEVALLAMTGSAVASGGASWLSVLALPLLFAAGMALCDSANAVMMWQVYGSTGSVVARHRVNLLMTGLTASFGLLVGAIYASALLVDAAGVAVLEPVAAISAHFEVVGYVVVASYAVLWGVALALTRRQASLRPVVT